MLIGDSPPLNAQSIYFSIWSNVFKNSSISCNAGFEICSLILASSSKFLQISENKYENVNVGNDKVALVSAIAGYSQEQFDTLQRIYNYGKQRVFSSISRIEKTVDGYSYEILRLDDPLAMAIGTLTNCCQELGNVAEVCMEHSMTSNDGRVFVIRDNDGNIVAQSWVWRNGNAICFDNVEIPDRAFARVVRENSLEVSFKCVFYSVKFLLVIITFNHSINSWSI